MQEKESQKTSDINDQLNILIDRTRNLLKFNDTNKQLLGAGHIKNHIDEKFKIELLRNKHRKSVYNKLRIGWQSSKVRPWLSINIDDDLAMRITRLFLDCIKLSIGDQPLDPGLTDFSQEEIEKIKNEQLKNYNNLSRRLSIIDINDFSMVSLGQLLDDIQHQDSLFAKRRQLVTDFEQHHDLKEQLNDTFDDHQEEEQILLDLRFFPFDGGIDLSFSRHDQGYDVMNSNGMGLKHNPIIDEDAEVLLLQKYVVMVNEFIDKRIKRNLKFIKDLYASRK